MRETRIRLDRHRLEEERVWRTRNYNTQVERVKSMLKHLIDVDIPQAERRLDYEDERYGGATHADVAGEIIGHVMQATSNMDFRGLSRDAADLSHVEQSIRELDELKASLPPEVVFAWEYADDAERDRREAEETGEQKRRALEDADRCEATVHDVGRGSNFHRCRKKHITVIDVGDTRRQVCGTHLKHPPSSWWSRD